MVKLKSIFNKSVIVTSNLLVVLAFIPSFAGVVAQQPDGVMPIIPPAPAEPAVNNTNQTSANLTSLKAFGGAETQQDGGGAETQQDGGGAETQQDGGEQAQPSQEREICDDGKDNDGDESIDKEDKDCQ